MVLEKIERCLGCRLPSEVSSKLTISVYYFPDEVAGETSVEIREVLYPDLMGQERDRKGATALKRAGDVLVSLTLLLILSPILLLIAGLIKLTSKGPVLFSQERLGQFGQPFQFLKFRSMYTNSDSSVHEQYIEDYIKNGKSSSSDPDGKPVFKLVKDARVTPVGRILRKTSLDEFPQFLNVLRGDMSLVGPRPPIPYELRQYDIWHRRRILEVRPGITGFWQVHGRSRTTFDEMVRMDLHYARHWSFWLDVKLLFQTPLAVIKGDGAV